MASLTPTQRRALRAQAHHLEPVVIIGHHGLTPAVLHEIDLALLAHDLVKVRVLGDDREARDSILAQACAALDCAPVQHVGKVLVVWRPNPERKPKAKPAVPKPSARRPANPAARGRKTAAARTPVDPVRERRRKARGGGTPTGHLRGAARHAPPQGETLPVEAPARPRRRRG